MDDQNRKQQGIPKGIEAEIAKVINTAVKDALNKTGKTVRPSVRKKFRDNPNEALEDLERLERINEMAENYVQPYWDDEGIPIKPRPDASLEDWYKYRLYREKSKNKYTYEQMVVDMNHRYAVSTLRHDYPKWRRENQDISE